MYTVNQFGRQFLVSSSRNEEIPPQMSQILEIYKRSVSAFVSN